MCVTPLTSSQPLLQTAAVNKDLSLPYLSAETKGQRIIYQHRLINQYECRLSVIKAQSVHLRRHYTKWTHMACKTICRPFQCFDCGVCVCVCVCFGGLPKANVDKVWPHESPLEKRWKRASIYTHILFLSLSPCLFLYHFFTSLSVFLPLFSHFSLFFRHSSLSASRSHTCRKKHAKGHDACVHSVLTVFQF